ncbi:hypothetical protein AMECASPLE_019865 [Ameca splendens]|uniref:Uncharacterized protein n=1 Tax=Ameca splendens TaxID=208324 RepID=A0ABV0ZDM9_9TELE
MHQFRVPENLPVFLRDDQMQGYRRGGKGSEKHKTRMVTGDWTSELANRLPPQEGEAVLRQHCLQWGWEAADLNWGHYRAVEGVL